MILLNFLAEKRLCLFLGFFVTIYNHKKNKELHRFSGINVRRYSFAFRLMLLGLLMGASSTVHAGLFCSDYPNGYIDGSDPLVVAGLPTQITIDTDCTFANFSADNPLAVTINFQTNDPSIYLIVFDDVAFDGNMACSNIDHKIWFSNGSDSGTNNSCQDLFIPVETIDKQAPAQTSVGIGEPFTYTLTLPSMEIPLGDPSPNELYNVILWDDISSATLGVDLTLVSVNAYYKGSGTALTLVPEDQPIPTSKCGIWSASNLCYKPIPIIFAGQQVVVEITAVLDDSVANTPGVQFTNVAKWWFGREIDINEDGFISPEETFTPLPGEWGIAAPMTIAKPDLVVTKASSDTALNLGLSASFSIDIQNIGGSDAWFATILDQLPDTATAGTCNFNPITTVSARIYAADGVTPVSGVLAPGTDYSISYTAAPTCQLNLTMLNSTAVIGPTERLIISYQTELDADTTADGFPLTNIAGATQWFSADGSYPRITYSGIVSDGTPATVDSQDSYTLTTGLSGYFFQKTVQNITSGQNPGSTAVPGDTLRYRLRLFNVDQTIDTITINDTLDPTKFDTSTFSMLVFPGGSTYSFDAVTGLLQVTGFGGPLNLVPGNELIVDFEIDLATSLSNGDIAPNQASLTADGPLTVDSDDPYVNGIAAPGDPADITNITIQSPGALSKVADQASATIGEQFTYTITVPAIPVNVPLYDVRILDDLTTSNADMSFVSASVVSGGAWVLSNTGSAAYSIIEDSSVGIDIPANSQAVIQIRVELSNSAANQSSLLFSNTAAYTYNRTNGNITSQTIGVADSSANMMVLEPHIASISKTVNDLIPTAGDTVRYSVTLTATGTAGYSDVFDVTLTDNLDLGLVYAGNPSVSIGAGVGADNTIGAPDISGDGIAIAQTLVWGIDSDVPSDMDIAAGTAITIAYDVRVLDSVLANQTLQNSAVAQWSGIDGVSGSERTGIDGIGGLNDYSTLTSQVSLTTPNVNATISKVRSSDTYAAADNNVRIGDVIEYTVTLTVGEGTLGNLQLVDTLPQGLDFDSVVSINGNIGPALYTAVAPFSHADIAAANIIEAGDPTLGSSSITWNLGNVTNQPNDGLDNNFVIIYRARVLNDVLPIANLNIPLNNVINMSYDTASGTLIQSDNDTVMTVLQPSLSVSKSAVPSGGDTVISAAEIVTYTIEINNIGTAPAYDAVLQDIIPLGMRNGIATVTTDSANLVVAGTVLPVPVHSYTAATGLVSWDFDSGGANTYTIPAGDTLRLVYRVQADAAIGAGLTLTNQAQITAYYSFDDEAVPTLGAVTGVRQTYAASNIATSTLYTGSDPVKTLISPAPVSPEASTGEQVIYRITVPGTVSSTTLHDVQITDGLDANLEFVSAIISGGGIGVSDTSISSQMNIAITQIPAGQQAIIELQTRVRNALTAQQGVTINNTASYTYAFTSGGPTQAALSSTELVTVTVVEPQLSVNKAVSLITPAPITGGDVLEYVITLSNSGTATAYDINVVDTLPVGLYLDTSFTATATIGGIAVPGFVATPTGGPLGPLIWGRANSDNSLDIPSGSSLLLTYRLLIDATAQANTTLVNSVLADWTSQDGVNVNERGGAGCPTVTLLNDYCSNPAAIASVVVADSNNFSKTVVSDSYAPISDASVRIEDTVNYQLALNLQEGVTRNVVVTDVLPSGLAFDGIVSINGDSVADYTAPISGTGSNFSYATITAAAVPALGQTNTLTFTLGNVANDPFGNATTDSLVIEYRVRVLQNTLANAASTALINTATLQYVDVAGFAVVDAARLESSANINVWQPVMSLPTKVDSVFANPANVSVANDVMHFTLQSCNTSGLAPAYSVQLTDDLATQLDESSIVGPLVNINGVAATAGVDYIYTAPTLRGGSMIFELISPVNPGQCVTINYDIGFYTDFGPNQSWNNSVTLDEYWSLPTQGGQQYTSLGPTVFTMTNVASIDLPNKVMLSPLSLEATIGEDVTYQISVPGVVANAALYDVVISDTLHNSLELVGATDISGNSLTIVDNSVGNSISLAIAQIPAGQQAIIELRSRVANNAAANAGTSFTNIASYTYATSAGGVVLAGGSSTTTTSLTIIEPLINLSKTVANISNAGNPPTAGDILRYSLTLTASGAAVGDNFSDAFDISINDNLSLGLIFQSGTASVTGAGNTITDPSITGDGTATAQNLSWQLSDATADIDITEGSTVTVTYDVVVWDGVLPNQTLSNNAIAQWTGLQAINVNERSGSASPIENDYFTAPVVSTLVTPDVTTLTKTRITDTWGAADNNVRIGDIVEYELRISLQEGLYNNVTLVDTLPQGLAYAGVVHINSDTTAAYTAVAPFVHGDITPIFSGDPATGPSNITFALGNISNAGDNITTNNEFVIVYRARLLDNVLTQQNNLLLNNNVQLDYTTATGVSNQISSSIINLLQPNLSITKTALAAGGDTIISANELVTYTVNVLNNGTAPAYDLVLQDIIPLGMRNAAATITMVSTTLAGAVVADINPVYDPLTGIAIWNFDNGIANTFTINAGDTLTLVYQVQADVDLGAGITLTNAATGINYYSFDDELPSSLGAISGVREIYGPTNTATAILTSLVAGALAKTNPADLTVSVGEIFTYRITVPAIPQAVALHDVRILDDLSASAADLSFVSVTKIAGSLPWVAVNSGTATNLIIEDVSNGIDIPPGEQVVIDITVQVNDSVTNVSGLLFNNTANYTYNSMANNVATQQNGLPATTANMSIVGPDNVTLEKSGPATMRVGVPATYTLNVHNTGSASAYDVTITDVLPNPVPGGMCDLVPNNISVQIFLADGITPVGAALAENTDFNVSFVNGTPSCTLGITMISAAAAIPADNRLIVSYDVSLDTDSANNSLLTNIAAATQWFSGDTAGAGATGQIRTYTRTLTNGTVGILDHEDAYTVLTESPTILFQKYVINTTTGQDPGVTATPGDVLRFRIVATNVSPVDVPNFSIIDEVDRLNNPAVFVPGSLTIVSSPAGSDITNTDPNGGTNNTGKLDVRNLSMTIAGGANDSVSVEFDITLASVIDSGTVALNQAFLQIYNLTLQPSDDPSLNGVDDPAVIGDEDANQILITAAPWFQISKISDDITGLATQLLPGDILRYTLTVKNVGTESALNSIIQDTIPFNTTYIADSTTLNGVAVADPVAGVSPIESGMMINAPEDTTAGYMRADATATTTNIATITFDVMINSDVINGSIISNQAYVNADGAGNSGAIAQQMSDDPNTVVVDDPTRDVVGSLPLVDSTKTVTLQVDNATPGVVDPNDVLRYTITVTNYGAVDASGVSLTDAVPANTTYIADSVTLNGIAVGQPDNGISPLISGIAISSSDLTPPLPVVGYLTPNGTATVTFDVMVNAATPSGTIISNQGFVATNELPVEATDADGLDSNGDQPTLIAVGNAQQLSISKTVSVVGGGPALAGGQLEYVVRVTNVGTVPATDVSILDDLDTPIPGQMTYVTGSASLNGFSNGIVYIAPTFTVDYANTYGLLQPGATAEFRFRVLLDTTLNIGQTITNIAQVNWNAMTQLATATANIDIGAMPGVTNINGRVWHDADFNDLFASSERALESWGVEIYFKGNLLDTVSTDSNGEYQIIGLAPNYLSTDRYELRFVAPGAGLNTAKLGMASSIFTNSLQGIADIITYPATNILDLNLPIDPNGVVYDSIVRIPVVGATLSLLNSSTNTALPATCFDDPAQQNQVTLSEGFYKFDINFSQAECVSGSDFIINVVPPANTYVGSESIAIPAQTNSTTAAFSVPTCLVGVNDAVLATPNHCEAQISEELPPLAITPGSMGTHYYLNLTLDNGILPGESQLYNNHIPLDPDLGQAVSVSKVSPKINVTRGDLVPYVITVNNTMPVPLSDVSVIDNIPAGFKYVKGSARVNDIAVEPVINSTQLTWDVNAIAVDSTFTIKLLLVVGGGLEEGEFTNRARVFSNLTNTDLSPEARATVNVVPDPTFDCTDIIGKVFNDKNLNGFQDVDETGLAAVRLATVNGLMVKTDRYGRFRITCAAVPNEQWGSNFILKLDDRSLPSGYRITGENPRVQRITRGKLANFNFSVAIHRVVSLDVADGAFEQDSSVMRSQWDSRLELLLEELRKSPSVLRLNYLGDVEKAGLAKARLQNLKARIIEQWKLISRYQLAIETKIFWRHGKPVSKDWFQSEK